MVLLIDGIEQNQCPSHITSFYEYFPKYKVKAKSFVETPIQNIAPSRLLYVSQREFAVSTSNDKYINIIGSEDATTCIIIVIQNLKSGAVGLSHLDGSDTKSAIHAMIEKVCEISNENELVVHLFGGFLDSKNYSAQLFDQIINILYNHPCCKLTLGTVCVGDCNTIWKNDIKWPIVYGIGVDIRTGRIFRATFKDKGPDAYLRSARIFCGNSKEESLNIYNNYNGQLQICPFDYEPMRNIHLWLQQDDQFLLEHLSTSPDVEPPDYVETIRNTFKFIIDNPFPLKTLFANGKARTYEIDDVTGLWKLIS